MRDTICKILVRLLGLVLPILGFCVFVFSC